MKKHFKKAISVILATALTVSMLPTQDTNNDVSAASVTLQNPRIVADSSMQAGQKVTWDCVWFGSYPQAEVIPSGEYTALDSSLLQDGDTIVSDTLYTKLKNATGWNANGDITIDGSKYRRIKQSDATWTTSGDENYYSWSDSTTYHYFKYEPIKWRVLNVDGNDALLLADKGLDEMYHEEWVDITWEDITIRSWLNGYGASSNSYGTDYSNSNFLDTAFSSVEQSSVNTTTVINDDNLHYGTEGGNNTNDKVFLLSESEVYTDNALSYGFVSDYGTYDEARRSKSSTYAKAMGTWSSTSTSTDYRGSCYWWLRSPGSSTDIASYVDSHGEVNRYGNIGDNSIYSVRPALHLNLSSSNLYSYAGTVCSDGGVNEEGNGSTPSNPEPDIPSYVGNSIQCASSCVVEENEKATVGIQAYGSTYEELKEVVDSVKWTAEDSSKVKVSMTGFIMPFEPTQYEREDGGIYETWITYGLLRIEGLKEGETTITGTASDGSKVTCKVTVTPKAGSQDGSGEGSGGSLTIGADASGKAGGGVAEFFPANWSAKNTVFPVEISKTTEEDGSYKIRGTVGIGRSDWLDDETTWNKYKQNVEDAQKYMGRASCLAAYKERWGVKSLTAVSTDKFKVLPKLSVMGYFENTYDKNGNVISSTGKIAADAKWEGSINWQFLTPIGPLYLNLEGSGKLSGEIGPEYDYNAKKLNIASGNLKLTPGISLEGGYGIDKVAQIGAKGSLELPITLIPATKGELEAKASIHLKLIFVIDYEHELATYKKTLWDTTTAKSAGLFNDSMAPINRVIVQEEKLTLMDTSFSKNTSKWNGKIPAASVSKKQGISTMATGVDVTNKDFEKTLMSGVLPSSMPVQKEINGKQVMIFQSYDDTRDTLNSTVLMYSICENGVWSEPQPVWDNGYADMYADMKVVNGKLVVAWQKEKALISGDVSTDSEAVLKDIAENSEICYAEFDEETGTFTNQTYVTDNSSYDMMPQICNDTDEVVISWIRNSDAELMQETGTNYIYTSKLNGELFDEEQMLLQSVGTVDNYVTYSNGTDIEAVYAGEQNDIKAVFDTDNQVIESLSELVMFAEDGTVSSINYNDGKIELISEGNIYSFEVDSKETTKMLAGESAFGNTAVYCSNGNKSGYIWSKYDEETNVGSIVASMKTENGYSEPVVIYEKEGVMWRYFSPVIDENGNWNVVANAMDTDSELNAIINIGKEETAAIELAGASVDENDVKDGLTGVDYFAVNNGDTAVDKIKIDMVGEDGSIITTDVVVTLMPGESIAGTAYVDIPKSSGKQEVSISIYADGQNDKDTVTDVVGLSNVSVTGSYTESEKNVEVVANVANSSSSEAKTVIHLYSDETMTNEIAVSQESTIAAGKNESVSFSVPKESITFNENGAAYLTLKAEVIDGDFDEDDNVAYVVLYKEEPTTTQPTTNVTHNTEVTTKAQTAVAANNVNKTTKEGNAVNNSKTTKLKKLVAKKKALKVTWKKKAGVNGYQLQYSTSKKLKKAKTLTIKKAKITSKTIKKLKAKKKYYVRIRTYITVDGKKYYSKWSKVKSKKTK